MIGFFASVALHVALTAQVGQSQQSTSCWTDEVGNLMCPQVTWWNLPPVAPAEHVIEIRTKREVVKPEETKELTGCPSGFHFNYLDYVLDGRNIFFCGIVHLTQGVFCPVEVNKCSEKGFFRSSHFNSSWGSL